MFRTILALVVTILHCYVLWRISSIPWISRNVPRPVLIILGVALLACFFLDRVLAPEASGFLGVVLELWSMTWMAALFLTAVSFLAVDLVTGFGFLFRGAAPALRSAALVVGVLLSAMALVQGLRAPVVRVQEVAIAGLPQALDGTVLIALADLHLGTVLDRQWLDKRLEQVRAERPDAVLLLGDTFEGHGVPGAELRAALAGLSAPLGVWGVLGNHDIHMPGNAVNTVFAESGVRLLHDEWTELAPGLILAGVDNLSSSRDAVRVEPAFTKALAGRPAGATLLLSHAPVAPELAASLGAGLMLSGHTHGGQIWPFSYFVKRQFPRYAGRYEVGPMTLVVSRGVGTWGPRMRLWRPAEIIKIVLHPAGQGK